MYGKTSAGVGQAPLIDSNRKLVTVPGGGKYADAAINGRLFYAANQTPVNTSTTLNTTFTGLGLANPTGSGKIIIVHEFGWRWIRRPQVMQFLLWLPRLTQALRPQLLPDVPETHMQHLLLMSMTEPQ